MPDRNDRSDAAADSTSLAHEEDLAGEGMGGSWARPLRPPAAQPTGAASGGGVREDSSPTSAKTSPAIAASRTAQPAGSLLK